MSGVAALPVAARLDGLTRGGAKPPRVAVLGAGAFGGWTALHLRRLGAEVVLIDAWGAGNARSSSGGETRVIRAIYGPDRVYVEMVQRSFEQWEHLQQSTEEPLYVETGALWLHRGEDSYVRSSAPLLAEYDFPLDKLEIAEASRRYPQIRFDGVTSVWLERRAGALAARRACSVVRDAFRDAGGTVRTGRAPSLPGLEAPLASLQLEDGSRIEADAYVFACGPWLGRLFPDVLGDAVRPTRQEVLYFGPPGGSERYSAASCPVWIDFGERIFYGIPDIRGSGFKIADDTRGEPFDPTDGDRTPTARAIARARALFSDRFPEMKDAPLLKSEVCQYENSPDGHLILDRHPHAANVWLLGGGSGHGFKLSPAAGELTANAVVSGKETPSLFKLARLRDVQKPQTQFERKE